MTGTIPHPGKIYFLRVDYDSNGWLILVEDMLDSV
jgi:hypothetical protein